MHRIGGMFVTGYQKRKGGPEYRGLCRIAAWLLLGFIPFLPPAVNAEPVVLYDSGQSRPITDYLFRPDPSVLATLRARPTLPDRTGLKPHPYPIQTKEMTPGEVVSRPVNFRQLPRPVFLVGTDPRSREWLVQYRDRLREVHAVGLVVEVESEAAFQALQSAVAGLDLTPASGSALAKQFKLSHYPVLIGPKRIEQ